MRAAGLLVVALVVGLASVTFVAVNLMGSSPGCARGEKPVLNESFTPEGPMLSTRPPAEPILSGGKVVSASSLNSETLGYSPLLPKQPLIPLQLITVDPDTSPSDNTGVVLVAYFGDRAPKEGETMSDYIGSGGYQLVERRSIGQTTQTIALSAGSRATVVQLGPWDGVMIHRDPLNGFRAYFLAWNDDQRDFTIMSGDDGSRVLDLGRAIYC